MAGINEMGMAGLNPSGGSMAVPGVGGQAVPAIGGTSNPLIPNMPPGNASPNATGFPAYDTTGGLNLSALSNLNVGGPIGGAGSPWADALTKAFHKAGYSSALASLLVNFLAGGAGFNPQIAQTMISALGPSVASGRANIMEQFGAEGLGSSSPAALGLAGFDSQVTLDEGQILSQLYEQSVQNYINLVMSGKQDQSQQGGVGSMLGGLLQGGGNIMGALGGSKGLLAALGIGGGAAASSAAAGGGAAIAADIGPMLAGLI